MMVQECGVTPGVTFSSSTDGQTETMMDEMFCECNGSSNRGSSAGSIYIEKEKSRRRKKQRRRNMQEN